MSRTSHIFLVGLWLAIAGESGAVAANSLSGTDGPRTDDVVGIPAEEQPTPATTQPPRPRAAQARPACKPRREPTHHHPSDLVRRRAPHNPVRRMQPIPTAPATQPGSPPLTGPAPPPAPAPCHPICRCSAERSWTNWPPRRFSAARLVRQPRGLFVGGHTGHDRRPRRDSGDASLSTGDRSEPAVSVPTAEASRSSKGKGSGHGDPIDAWGQD